MEAINPFSDPEFKKKILEKEGKLDQKTEDYEFIDDPSEEVVTDMKSIISATPKMPGNKTVKNIIVDASALAKNEKEARAQEMTNALNTVLTNYNKEYGLNLNLDLNNLSNALVTVSDEKNLRILELYLSNFYRGFKPILILHMMQKLALAIDYILQPENLFSQQMSIQDIYIVCEKLLQFVDQLDSLKGEVQIAGADLELKKLAEENEGSGVDLSSKESQEAIDSFMKLFNKDLGNNNDNIEK